VKLGWHHWSFKNQESESGNHEFYGVGLDGKINETNAFQLFFLYSEVSSSSLALIFD
jgi:hypothetical protein